MRLNKKQKSISILMLSLLLMIGAIPLGIWVTHTQSAQLGNGELRCRTQNESRLPSAHNVIFQNGKITPVNTVARRCDTLTITNLDPQERLIAFGPHEHHISYDGVSERLLSQAQSLTVTLITAGTYQFHDHIDDALKGSFTVNQ